MNSNYTKKIESTSTGMVVASCYHINGDRVGVEFFSNPFNSLETRFIKAHKWADKRIEICEKHEERSL